MAKAENLNGVVAAMCGEEVGQAIQWNHRSLPFLTAWDLRFKSPEQQLEPPVFQNAARAGKKTAATTKTTRNKMKIKSTTKHEEVLAEGTYNTALNSVTPKPTEAKPKFIQFGFKAEGYDKELHKELPASFNEGSPLRADTETILGRSLTAEEVKDGFELNTLIGMKCQVVVFHKAGSGGRPKPVVSLVLPASA